MNTIRQSQCSINVYGRFVRADGSPNERRRYIAISTSDIASLLPANPDVWVTQLSSPIRRLRTSVSTIDVRVRSVFS